MNDVHYSSKSDDWETPQYLFDKIMDEFHPDVDVCADALNHKCPLWFAWTPSGGGLTAEWCKHSVNKCVFMNPPYGRQIGKWVEKAYKESLNGCTVVCLLPARTDTKWFHDYCIHGELRFIRGRLKFGKATNSAPFPSMIVIFKP